MESEIFKSEGIDEWTVRRQVDAGESRGQGSNVLFRTRQIDIHKLWQMVGNGVQSFPRVDIDTGILRPPKSPESFCVRREDGDEDVRLDFTDVKWGASAAYSTHLQFSEVWERCKVREGGLDGGRVK